jgi:anion-transporting  ArsA/GET3 family ATPase
MTKRVNSLFDRRLLVVVGKGGVGKTTVACALGMVAAQQGKRVLIAEVDGVGRAAALLGIEPAPIGESRMVKNSLSVMSVEGSRALEEYLQIIVPIKRVLKLVFDSKIYHYFVAAAPGLKELMTIGKIWFEAERVDEDSGRPLWDLVIMDAPATGHSLQYLGMPRAAHKVFQGGLVGRESQRLIDLLTDPARCAINLVTTAEEMPVNETLEMYERLRGDLDMPLGALFVNRVHKVDWTEQALAGLQPIAENMRSKDERQLFADVIDRAREEQGWAEINHAYLERLRSAIEMPFVEIPFEFAEEFGAAEMQRVTGTVRLGLEGARSTGRHAST